MIGVLQEIISISCQLKHHRNIFSLYNPECFYIEYKCIRREGSVPAGLPRRVEEV
jgi:hypothetical protein